MRFSIAILAAVFCLVPIAVTSAQEVVIEGRVLRDADGSPVAGVVVEIGISSRRTMAFEGERASRTDAEGRFRFVGLPRGAAALQVSGSGFATEIRRLRGGPVEPEIFRLVPGRTIRGRVLAAGSGEPIAGAVVVAERHRVKTDAEGRYALEGLRRDLPRITVSAEASSFVPVVRTVRAAEAEGEITLKLDLGWMLAVEVTDAEGQPLAGASVEARLPRAVAYSAMERAAYEATTDENGVAELSGLPPRQPVSLTIALEGFITAQSPVVMPAPPSRSGDPVSPSLVIDLVTGQTLSVCVLGSDMEPIVGARVDLRPLIEPRLSFGGPPTIEMTRGSYREGRIGEAGWAAFDLLPNDWITCEVRAPGYRTRQFVLAPGRGRGTGVVVSLDSDPAPPAEDLPWSASVEEAWLRADHEGLPLLISMTMDGEPANDYMSGEHWHDSEVVRVARELPLLLSSVFPHTEIHGICARYGAIPCASHQVVEPYAVENFVNQTSFEVPRQIFLDPAGRVLMYRIFYLSERELIRMMMRALRIVKPEVAIRLARERLPGMLEALTSETEARRAEAILALSTLVNAGDEHAVSLLLDLIRADVPPDARLLLLSLLIPEAIEFPASAYRSLFGDPDPRIRLEACCQLGRVADDSQVIELLASRLDDIDPEVRSAIAAVLRITEEHGDVTVADAAAGERWRIVASLLETVPVEHLPGLRSLLGALAGAPRNTLLRAIAAQAPNPTAIQILVSECGRDGVTAAVPALEALRKAAPAAPDPKPLLDILRRHLDRRDPLIREAALRAIAALRLPEVDRVLRLVVSAPLLFADDLRTRAALALWERGECLGAKLLYDALDDPLLGAAVEQAFRRAYDARRPDSRNGWHFWLTERGLIKYQ